MNYKINDWVWFKILNKVCHGKIYSIDGKLPGDQLYTIDVFTLELIGDYKHVYKSNIKGKSSFKKAILSKLSSSYIDSYPPYDAVPIDDYDEFKV